MDLPTKVCFLNDFYNCVRRCVVSDPELPDSLYLKHWARSISVKFNMNLLNFTMTGIRYWKLLYTYTYVTEKCYHVKTRCFKYNAYILSIWIYRIKHILIQKLYRRKKTFAILYGNAIWHTWRQTPTNIARRFFRDPCSKLHRRLGCIILLSTINEHLELQNYTWRFNTEYVIILLKGAFLSRYRTHVTCLVK